MAFRVNTHERRAYTVAIHDAWGERRAVSADRRRNPEQRAMNSRALRWLDELAARPRQRRGRHRAEHAAQAA